MPWACISTDAADRRDSWRDKSVLEARFSFSHDVMAANVPVQRRSAQRTIRCNRLFAFIDRLRMILVAVEPPHLPRHAAQAPSTL